MRRYSRIEAFLTKYCPDCWLDSSQRVVKRSLHEAGH